MTAAYRGNRAITGSTLSQSILAVSSRVNGRIRIGADFDVPLPKALLLGLGVKP